MPIMDETGPFVIHNCANCFDRSPIGSIKTGEEAVLRLRVRGTSVSAAEVMFFCDESRRTIKMRREQYGFTAETGKITEAGVYFYYFILHTEKGIMYYGRSGGETSVFGAVSTSVPPAFQMTVYSRGFETPRWFRCGVMYQIFPDRYARGEETAEKGAAYHRALGRKIELRQWGENVRYLPENDGERYYPCDFFGGTLDGIRRGLERLHALGVSVIYLNPIFEADSNHRYNTADYLRIDPILGENADLAALCSEAAGYGIRMILDGVFSHTGADSVYFNRFGRYPSAGAYQGEASPYFSWYRFESFPNKYRCWWGFESLPEVDEHESSWQKFIITDEDSVVRHWLREGASGYRLDVADELPDDVIELIRTCAKEEKPDAVILGEVWEDPTTKTGFGQRRRYALGTALDSVMNYPLRSALIDFSLGGTDAHAAAALILHQRLDYPVPLYYSLMNLLSSHDRERIRTVLSTGRYGEGLSREEQAALTVSDEEDALGMQRQAMLAAVQFTLPGIPCIYYGDEFGMQGLLDPFNRAPLDKNASAYPLTDEYAALSKLRRENPALTDGKISVFAPNPDVLCIIRAITDSRGEFGHPAENGVFIIAANRSDMPRRIAADLYTENAGMDGAALRELRALEPKYAEDVKNSRLYPLTDGIVDIEVPARTSLILRVK